MLKRAVRTWTNGPLSHRHHRKVKKEKDHGDMQAHLMEEAFPITVFCGSGCLENTSSVAFEKRGGSPDCRGNDESQGPLQLCLSVGLGAWGSACCDMKGEPGQILSFMKAAVGGAFPTWDACWKHLAHEHTRNS